MPASALKILNLIHPIFANKFFILNKQQVIFEDLGIINYKSAWDYQEELVKKNTDIKVELRKQETNLPTGQAGLPAGQTNGNGQTQLKKPVTTNYLLFCEHPPVYTLGKSGHIENALLNEDEMEEKEIEFFRTNRGGDITFHGLQQVVGYPILDLGKILY